MKDKFKKFGKKITENKVVDAFKKKTKKSRELLKDGKNGGIILLSLYSAQFLYGCVLYIFGKVLPVPIVILAGLLAVIIISELCALLIKLLLGGGKRSRVYFYIAILLSVVSNINSVSNYNVWAIVIALAMPLCVDVFGRCLFGMIIKKHKVHIGGVSMLVLSFAIILLFGFVFRFDCFGRDVKSIYLSLGPSAQNEVEGFSEYLQNGPFTVKTLDYGSSGDEDLVTESVDVSYIANNDGFMSLSNKLYFESDLSQTPVAGRIWYPEGLSNCPVLFIVHGNHDFATPSHLGYDYLGEYLASNGYTVVSVDENRLNELSNENDARAILFLENIKALLEANRDTNSPIYGLIDDEKIAVAGHSRGGESVSTAFLFNDFSSFPDNGNIKLKYDFNIKSVIAIAPTVDQYNPAGHSVELEEVNYLLIHGANDQDVVSLMGEKQYNNVEFSRDSDNSHFKAYVYILGANHGQFNSLWGRYDSWPGFNGFLNTSKHLSENEQQTIAKAYIRTFLDATLLGEEKYANLLKDNTEYMASLPQTIIISNYMDSNFDNLCSFDEEPDLNKGEDESIGVNCYGMSSWREIKNSFGNGMDENYVLDCRWPAESEPMIEISFPARDVSKSDISFRIADMTEDDPKDAKVLKYSVQLVDAYYNSVDVDTPGMIYPALAVQLYKTDVFMNTYEYKHQMETIFIRKPDLSENEEFDYTKVCKIRIYFDGSEYGNIILDDIGITDKD